MIWSIMPEDFVFDSQSTEQALTVINYLGKRVSVRNGKLETLHSTNPADFMDSRFAPGASIRPGLEPTMK